VPTLDDALLMTRVLARSATGQAASAYTTVATGAARAGDADGPGQFHVVLLDNGRSTMLADQRREMLRCIRCGACMNHCPVYGAIGGHAYGWVYPGPMGAVLTPSLTDMRSAADLPNASTFCGRCDSVCPVRIPLTSLLRGLRTRQFEERITPPRARLLLSVWGFLAARPALYRTAIRLASLLLRAASGGRGRLARVPFGSGWCAHRDLPAPAGESFASQWRRRTS
jgi:L-lactate dehydrogenase complex protein LldF